MATSKYQKNILKPKWNVTEEYLKQLLKINEKIIDVLAQDNLIVMYNLVESMFIITEENLPNPIRSRELRLEAKGMFDIAYISHKKLDNPVKFRSKLCEWWREINNQIQTARLFLDYKDSVLEATEL